MAEVTDIDVTSVSSVDEALALIDASLGDFSSRQLLSTAEVSNLLLDVRLLLSEETTSS